MPLEFLVDVLELLVDGGHRLFERFLVADDLCPGDGQWGANAGDDILALRIRKILAEELAFAR